MLGVWVKFFVFGLKAMAGVCLKAENKNGLKPVAAAPAKPLPHLS